MWDDEESGSPSWDAWSSFEPTNFDYGVFTSPEFNEAFEIANPEFFPQSESNPLGYDPNASYNLPTNWLDDVKRVAASVGGRTWNAIKSAFTKPDGSVDFRALATAGGALLPILAGGSESRPTGYQGGIPQYTAVRQAVSESPTPGQITAAQNYFQQNPDVAAAYQQNSYGLSPEQFAQTHYQNYGKAEKRAYDTNLGAPSRGVYDPNRRPGSSGQRYFTDVQYVTSENVPAAQTAAAEQAKGLAALNAANPLNAAPPAYQPPAPPPATSQPAPPAYNESYSGANVLNTVRQMLGTQNLARGGIVGLQDGGFVVPADVVSHLGNGSTDAGLAHLTRKGAVPIRGEGDGMSDSNRTTINGRQPAAVADGEAYLPPRQVQNMGGAEKLYAMMDKIRRDRTGTTKQGKQINPNQYV